MIIEKLLILISVSFLLIGCKSTKKPNKLTINFKMGEKVKIPETKFSFKFNGMTYVTYKKEKGAGSGTAFSTWDIIENGKKTKTHELSIINKIFKPWKITDTRNEYSSETAILTFSRIESLKENN